MKNYNLFLLGLVLFCTPFSLQAKDLLDKADQKCVKLNLSENERKQCFKLYKKAVEKNPESYEANWKMARAYRVYTVYAYREKQDGWKDICEKYGQKCLNFAEKAVEKNPDRVEGHFYFGLCVDSYSKGVSMFTAINKGLKDKALKHFSRAYSLDKKFLKGAPILALACLWDNLPWPFRDTQKALQYYREAEKMIPKKTFQRSKLQLNMGNFLLETGRNTKKGKKMLQRATNATSTYLREKAKDILKRYQ